MELFEFRLLPEDFFGNIELPGETIWIPAGIQPKREKVQ